jgi:amino acid adenylation domain-containing protein
MNAILTKLRMLKIELTLLDGKLKINAPEGVMTPQILDEVKASKDLLVSYLSGLPGKDNFCPIKNSPEKEFYKSSSVQKRMYFLNQMDSQSVSYNMPQVFRITGNPDKDKISSIFRQLVIRHESLRTRFQVVGEELVQKIGEGENFEVEYVKADRDDIKHMIEDFVKPFDLSTAPLLRATLAETGENEFYLMMDMHHIISDGTSCGLLVSDFINLYAGQELPPLTLHYKDFAEWQQSREQLDVQVSQKDFWCKEFGDEIPVLVLPYDFERPATKSFRGNAVTLVIEETEKKLLASLAERQGSTLFMLMFSFFNILLSKLSYQEDIVVGIPTSGRQHDDLEPIIGMFVNTLPLRNYPKAGMKFSEFLNAVQQRGLAGMDKQAYQLESLIDELKIERSSGRNPLFDILFSYHSHDGSATDIPGLTFTAVSTENPMAKFDLTLTVTESENDISLNFNYSVDLFKKQTIDKFARYFTNIVTTVLSNPGISISDISLLTDSEKDELLTGFNNTSMAYDRDATLMSLFEAQAQKTPGNTALRIGSRQVSYRELSHGSSSISAYLIAEAGIAPGDLVGILMEREEYLLHSIYGVLKAGAAYVPMDINYPADRIRAIVADSGMKAIITRGRHLSGTLKSLPGIIDLDIEADKMLSYSSTAAAVPVKSSDLAYVIYTSGSTGQPKGVMIEHGSAVNLLTHMQQQYPVNSNDVYLLKTNYCFDVSVAELFGWYLDGGSLFLLPVRGEADAITILDNIASGGVTHVNFVPSMFSLFLEEMEKDKGNRTASLRYIFLAGEALPSVQVRKFNSLQSSIQLENIYGPTEATIYCCGYSTSALQGRRNVPIGKPFGNVQLYVLGSHNSLQPAGVPGELCIGGSGLARGYLNNEALTAEKFVSNPYGPGLIYKTGDLVKWTSSGEIDFLGRIDEQVKIRGFRIELGEIEYQMSRHHSVRNSVVLVKEQGGEKNLVGYYQSADMIKSSEWRNFLSGSLPDYMVPLYYVQMDSFPQTTSGKLNRKLFPDPEAGAETEYVAPSNETEEKLAEIWADVLKLDKGVIGVNRNFFELGGHSLRAMVLVNKIARELDVTVPLKDIFDNATILKLSELIKIHQWVTHAASTNDEERMEITI